MSDYHLVDPQGWEYDLQSVYSAYMGYFQLHCVPWHDRTWSQYFETFEQFLAFSWPVITVTDARTGRAHIVTRMSSIAAFVKMIKARFGEPLPQVDNMLRVKPLETSQRHLVHVCEWSTYKKLYSALPAVALATLKARVRAGDPSVIRELWAARDKTFLAIDFEPLDRSDRSCVEWGYAVIRSSHLDAVGAWPPSPDTNYRKGHYIISDPTEMLGKVSPSVSWQYAFGESQVIPKPKMPRIVQSVLSGLLSPESETVSNSVVLVGHGVQAITHRLEEMRIKLPNNVLVVDIAYLERALFTTGERGPMHDRKTGRARLPESLLSLGGVLRSLGIDPPCALHNAGNDALMAMVAFQRMVDPRGAVSVVPKGDASVGSGPGVWKAMGKGGEAVNGNGHVKRAATVAARLFRPLVGTQLDFSTNGTASANGSKNGTKDGNGMGMGTGDLLHPQMRTVGPGSRGTGAGNVDEMGMLHAVPKRASMFGALTLLSSADKHKKGVGSVGTSGSVSVFEPASGGTSGGGWMSPLPSPPIVAPSLAPDRRRHSTIEKRW